MQIFIVARNLILHFYVKYFYIEMLKDKVEKTDKTRQRQRQGGCQRDSVHTIKSTRQIKYVFLS